MKGFLISILVSIALSHSEHQKNNGFLKSATKRANLLRDYINNDNLIKNFKKENANDELDAETAKSKAKVLQKVREYKEKFNYLDKKYSDNVVTKGFQKDPVLNGASARRSPDSDTDTISDSSSVELRDWKEEWKELWMKQRESAFSATNPGGDRVNFIAARPWGIPCGDPAQHDMPWGTCVIPAECDAEYRIYRGDYFCGRTQFICCSLSFTTYDTYQALDVSLDQTSMETDSAERLQSKYKSQNKKKRENDRKRRKRMRDERKRKIRRTIERIVKEVRKILNRAYRNGTKIRKKKTKTMKKFIRFLKRQYRMDRDSVKDLHEQQLWQVDKDLLDKLYKIKDVNKNFMSNDTFRDIILNRTMNARGARMLMQAYPELEPLVLKDVTRMGKVRNAGRRGDAVRRSGYAARLPRRRKYLDYDVEYGLLYS